MQNDSEFESKMPNGWTFQTVFGELENGQFSEYDRYKMPAAEVESFHLRILQYFTDFHALPVVGDILEHKDSGFTVFERWVELDKKRVVLFLLEGIQK